MNEALRQRLAQRHSPQPARGTGRCPTADSAESPRSPVAHSSGIAPGPDHDLAVGMPLLQRMEVFLLSPDAVTNVRGQNS